MKQVPRDRKPNIVKYKTLATYELDFKLFGFNKLNVIMIEIMKPHGKNSDKFKTVYTLVRILTNENGLPINHTTLTLNKSIRKRNENISKINPEIQVPTKLYKAIAELDYGKCFTKKLFPDNINEILKQIEEAIAHWTYILGLKEYDDEYLGIIEKEGKSYHATKTLTEDGWQTKYYDIANLEMIKTTFEELQGEKQ